MIKILGQEVWPNKACYVKMQRFYPVVCLPIVFTSSCSFKASYKIAKQPVIRGHGRSCATSCSIRHSKNLRPTLTYVISIESQALFPRSQIKTQF